MSNNLNEARLDSRNQCFWERRQQAFFDLKVFVPNACFCRYKSLKQCHVMNEQENKRVYNKGILQIDNVTFTLLVFSVVWEESAKMFTRVWHKFYLKRETSAVNFK